MPKVSRPHWSWSLAVAAVAPAASPSSQRRNEDWARAMLENAPDLVVLVDRDGRIQDLNHGTSSHPREYYLGRFLYDSLPSGDSRSARERMARVFDRGETVSYAVTGPGAEGHTRWFTYHAAPVRSEGTVVAAVVVLRDITDARSGDESLAERAGFNEALANLSREALRAGEVNQLLTNGVATVSAALGVPIVHVLELRENGTEFTLRAAVGWTPGAVGKVTVPADPDTVAGFALRQLDPVVVGDYRTEERLKPTSILEEMGARCSVAVLLPGENRPFGIFGVADKWPRTFTRDQITFIQAASNILAAAIQRSLTEEARREADVHQREIQQLKDRDEFRSNFINTAAHELRTPLTPIKLQLHVLKTVRGGELSPEQHRSLQILDRNVDRLSQLVQDVLDGARLQAGRLQLAMRPVDLNALVKEAIESFQEPARQAGLTLEYELGGNLVVEADANRLTQVMFNLLSNAVKYTPEGGHLRVETGKSGDRVFVRVRDTGTGLSAEQISRLFKPFSQVHDTMQTSAPGTGLGLYISKGIIELHGGRIWAESPGPRLGSVFSFEVAASKAARPVPPVPARPTDRPTAREALARRVRELI
jgi:PAS domain S-box-containing protein